METNAKKYKITHNGRYLTYYFENNNCCGKIQDQIGFNDWSYNVYDSTEDIEKEIQNRIKSLKKQMADEFSWRQIDFAKNLIEILNNCKATEIRNRVTA